MSEQPTTIIAVVSDDRRAQPVLARATRLGQERDAQIILYDVSATGTIFEAPLPTEFASDGPDKGVPPLLTSDDLDAAGQATLAGRVRALEVAGIDAYGWLPETTDADDLVEYARGRGASLVLASAELEPTAARIAAAGLPSVETVGSSPD